MTIIISKMKSVFAKCLLLIILLSLFAIPTHLSGAQIVNIVVRNSADELMVDIKLKDVFTGELKAALTKGIPIDIAFSVSLFEVHSSWFDKKIISNTSSSIRYIEENLQDPALMGKSRVHCRAKFHGSAKNHV